MSRVFWRMSSVLFLCEHKLQHFALMWIRISTHLSNYIIKHPHSVSITSHRLWLSIWRQKVSRNRSGFTGRAHSSYVTRKIHLEKPKPPQHWAASCFRARRFVFLYETRVLHIQLIRLNSIIIECVSNHNDYDIHSFDIRATQIRIRIRRDVFC